MLKKPEQNPESPALLIEQGPFGRVETNASDLRKKERTRRCCQVTGDLQSVTPILVGSLGNSAWVVWEN